MNSVKNLMIIAVLGAVGYGVYVSLSRNNVDPAQSRAWPTDGRATRKPICRGQLGQAGRPAGAGRKLDAARCRRQSGRRRDRAPVGPPAPPWRKCRRADHLPLRPA